MMTAAVEEHGAITATIMVVEDFMYYSVRLLHEGCMTEPLSGEPPMTHHLAVHVLVSPSGFKQGGEWLGTGWGVHQNRNV